MKKPIFILLFVALLYTGLSLLKDTKAFNHAAANSKNTRVLFTTNFGDILIQLNSEKAPLTTKNFLEYVKNGFYKNTVFHRVIKGFMIQGGGFSIDLSRKKAGSNIANEADNGLLNEKYSIAMARTNDPHSASSQFFINTSNNTFLNHRSKSSSGWGYCVFGKVIKGFDVVDKIELQQTVRKGMHQNVPAFSIFIRNTEIIN